MQISSMTMISGHIAAAKAFKPVNSYFKVKL